MEFMGRHMWNLSKYDLLDNGTLDINGLIKIYIHLPALAYNVNRSKFSEMCEFLLHKCEKCFVVIALLYVSGQILTNSSPPRLTLIFSKNAIKIAHAEIFIVGSRMYTSY